MEGKKQKIIHSAIKCFSEKGYRGTSIQDIADSIGIAKGSLYFYFKSKEDLLLSIIKYYLKTINDEFQELIERVDLSTEDLLREHVIMSYRMYDKHKNFFSLLMQERLEVNAEMHELIVGARRQGLFYCHQMIIRVYGERVRPYACDAAVLFQAIMDGYLGLAVMGNQNFDTERLGSYVRDRTDVLVHQLIESQAATMLGDETLEQWNATVVAGQGGKTGILLEIDALKKAVDQADLQEAELDEVHSTLEVLGAEFEKAEPQPVVIKGMLALLKTIHSAKIKKQVVKLESQVLELL
ncbi:TetR/AcrR family transcriptional regulator [Paenibacillus mendelii]|uniref:TetR/AcrR family transcriptional regulator n=1 Tax=Paenibacillus mendelii TaxID=206163 RepID=A0ABV6JB76_9BACL|nr:TetR/AcrR family transcriptional regulator [Paenibacillus mendelii]MCQ6560832.1 TetR/AcrR family transcriptional regulator [Paenibacillus mendelii]